MFRGRSLRNIDAKGRLMIPSEFRDGVFATSPDGKFILTNLDDAISCYPLPAWVEIEQKISQVKNANRELRNFTRFFLGGAQELVLDNQGRILIPQTLRDYAGLNKEVYLVGMGRKIEIWDKARYDEQILAQKYEDFSDALAATGMEVSL